jgi:ATP-binding protein involved in chromosome partitioning
MKEIEIRAALAPFDLSGALESAHLHDGHLRVTLAIRREDAAAAEARRAELEAVLGSLPEVRRATILFTAHRDAPQPLLPGVAHVVAVASGKGGVGKSTVAVNLAVALTQAGMRVGLLDADIYGPSLPRMLGLNAAPQVKDNLIQPLRAWGFACMSIGFMVSEETAMIWRGPMVMGALNQLLGQVKWGELDVLVVDLPPGTGDAQLTLAQKLKLRGAVVVSTPQDIALIDARRGVKMFEQMGVPVLGIVENMSYFSCPHCGGRTDIFGHGGAAAEAAQIGVPLLGEVPLLPVIRETGDAGTPVTAAAPDGQAAAAFRAIAAKLLPDLARSH